MLYLQGSWISTKYLSTNRELLKGRRKGNYTLMIWILNTYQWLVLLLNQGAKAYCEYNLGFFFFPLTVSECICGLEERSYMETDQWYSETWTRLCYGNKHQNFSDLKQNFLLTLQVQYGLIGGSFPCSHSISALHRRGRMG